MSFLRQFLLYSVAYKSLSVWELIDQPHLIYSVSAEEILLTDLFPHRLHSGQVFSGVIQPLDLNREGEGEEKYGKQHFTC